MTTAIDHSDCPPEKCLWERCHFWYLLESNQEFMKTNVDHVNMGILRQTRLSFVNDNLEIDDGVKMVKEPLITLAWRLHHDLSNDVFDQGTVTMKEHIRVICALKSLICKIKDQGAVATGFKEAARL